MSISNPSERYHPYFNSIRKTCIEFTYSSEMIEKLPKEAGIYVITIISCSSYHVLYVGKTKNFYKRFFAGHHRKPELDLLDKVLCLPKIYCLLMPGASDEFLAKQEKHLIDELNPLINRMPVLCYRREA